MDEDFKTQNFWLSLQNSAACECEEFHSDTSSRTLYNHLNPLSGSPTESNLFYHQKPAIESFSNWPFSGNSICYYPQMPQSDSHPVLGTHDHFLFGSHLTVPCMNASINPEYSNMRCKSNNHLFGDESWPLFSAPQPPLDVTSFMERGKTQDGDRTWDSVHGVSELFGPFPGKKYIHTFDSAGPSNYTSVKNTPSVTDKVPGVTSESNRQANSSTAGSFRWMGQTYKKVGDCILPENQVHSEKGNNSSTLASEPLKMKATGIASSSISIASDKTCEKFHPSSSSPAAVSGKGKSQKKKVRWADMVTLSQSIKKGDNLFSTGIFDDTPVAYCHALIEFQTLALIRRNGFMCGCSDCQFETFVSAEDLEIHAGWMSTQPEKRIYIWNGKTVYELQQELKRTPPEKLQELIESVTGSKLQEHELQMSKRKAPESSNRGGGPEIEKTYRRRRRGDGGPHENWILALPCQH